MSSKSSSVAVIGLRLTRFNLGVYASGITGNPLGTSGPFHILGTPVYINASSKEWKVITEILPSTFTNSIACSIESSKADNSSFTAIRSA